MESKLTVQTWISIAIANVAFMLGKDGYGLLWITIAIFIFIVDFYLMTR